jgi:hypothetical protein
LRRSVQPRCEVVRARDYTCIGTQVIDLSAKGLLLESDAPVLTGEELLVLFRTPRGDWYDCDAKVARVLHGRRRWDDLCGIGIAFEGLDPWREILLCESLRDAPIAPRHLAAHSCRGRG